MRTALVAALCLALTPVLEASAKDKNPSELGPEEVFKLRKKVVKERLAFINRRIAEEEGAGKQPVSFLNSKRSWEQRLKKWNKAGKGLPVQESVGVLERQKQNRYASWRGALVLHFWTTSGGKQKNTRATIPPSNAKAWGKTKYLNTLVRVRFVDLDPDPNSSYFVLHLVKVQPFKKLAEVRTVMKAKGFQATTLEGVPFRTGRKKWMIQPEDQKRKGPFYHVQEVTKGAGSLKKHRFKWCSFEAFLIPPHRQHGHSTHLYLLSMKSLPAAGHQRAIKEAKRSEAFHMGGGGLVSPRKGS